MFRVAVICDSHFDRSNRPDDCRAVHAWIAEDVRKRDVNAVALGGDLFEGESTIADRNDAADWVQVMAEIAEVVGVKGNHEVGADLAFFNKIKAKHPVTFYDVPAVHRLSGASIACLPWPRKAALLASIGTAVSSEESNQIAATHLRNILRGLGAEPDGTGGERLFLGHVALRGAKVSTERRLQPGTDFELGTEDLGLVRASAYMLGHIHQKDEVSINGAPCFYPGTPRHHDFGETGLRQYAIVSVENGKATVEYIATPSVELVTLRMRWTGAGFEPEPGSTVPFRTNVMGTEVRLRYSCDPDQAPAARMAARDLERSLVGKGAVACKVDPAQINVTARARAPEVASAATLMDKLDVLWKTRSITVEPERRERLAGRVAQLELEAKHASR